MLPAKHDNKTLYQNWKLKTEKTAKFKVVTESVYLCVCRKSGENVMVLWKTKYFKLHISSLRKQSIEDKDEQRWYFFLTNDSPDHGNFEVYKEEAERVDVRKWGFIKSDPLLMLWPNYSVCWNHSHINTVEL